MTPAPSDPLRLWLQAAEAQRLLREHLPQAESWTCGGCWPLARALQSVLGSGAEVRVVVHPFPLHAATFFEGRVYDGGGIWPPGWFEAKWEGAAYIQEEEARQHRMWRDGARCPSALVRALTPRLSRLFQSLSSSDGSSCS